MQHLDTTILRSVLKRRPSSVPAIIGVGVELFRDSQVSAHGGTFQRRCTSVSGRRAVIIGSCFQEHANQLQAAEFGCFLQRRARYQYLEFSWSIVLQSSFIDSPRLA